MSFVAAVKSIPSIAGCMKNGLQALGANSTLIRPSDTKKCEGSIDIDACLQAAEPNANRWDYAIGYDAKAYFVEVHPASGQVSEVIEKCKWLRAWLKADGAPLAAIHADGVFHWKSTGRVNIGRDKYRLASEKIILNGLRLD